MSITREKLNQAKLFVADSGLDVWLTFVRETAEGGDPVLPLILEGGLTWQSALLVFADGRTVAIVGNYDADPIAATGDWDEVIPYVQGIRTPLLDALKRIESSSPRIGVNFSKDDVKADGLSHGMYLLLIDYLEETRFEGALESAGHLVMRLRGIKADSELQSMRKAIDETDRLFSDLEAFVYLGVTEREAFDFIQDRMDSRKLGYSWDRHGDPIVNFGPNSMIGHGVPSPTLELESGQILHVDLGVICEGYASDIQRCWFVGNEVPADVQCGFEAVFGAISAGADQLKPGVKGHEVDAASRAFLIAAGFPEYLHALGHQVGRVAHDGGVLLGPRWERYGNTPEMEVEEGQVYTLELGVTLEGRGYLGLEEMVVVTARGCEFLTLRQDVMKPILG